jgi:hypothetical protein
MALAEEGRGAHRGLDVEVGGAPVAEGFHVDDELEAGFAEAVSDLRRGGVGDAAEEDAVFLELA